MQVFSDGLCAVIMLCTVMGIHGLLPFLKKASRPSNVKEFKGCTVAIDSYCWLHRGAFACAEKLALGQQTDQSVVLFLCMSQFSVYVATRAVSALMKAIAVTGQIAGFTGPGSRPG